jgi:hypothetical protein
MPRIVMAGAKGVLKIMHVASLQSPLVRRTIETINEGRLDDFMALFARNATLVDGATYQGLLIGNALYWLAACDRLRSQNLLVKNCHHRI